MSNVQKTIYIDPSYATYNEDRLFDVSDPVLGRDGTLQPFGRARSALAEKQIDLRTADYLFQSEDSGGSISDYYSLGILDSYPKLVGRSDVRLKGFWVMEPPVVAPKLYRALPELTRHFEHVYLHNVEGDGYSLKNVDRSRLRRFYWPQPFRDVLEPYWSQTDRQKRIVVINGNHIPRSLNAQLYGKRIEAMAKLAKKGVVDLYGRGWHQWWSHRSMWPPYWLNYRVLMSIYKGACESKYAVLSQYRFSLCFENMAMDGYVTEKLFDCLYAGTIPLYLGAKNIDELVPSGTYIDCRPFSSWDALWNSIISMSEHQISQMREAGRAFIKSDGGMKYYDSLQNILSGEDCA